MKCYVGIDLGSTTTKAVVLDENKRILGAGITNSRSNYDVARKIARDEAFTNSRFTLLDKRAKDEGLMDKAGIEFLEFLKRQFFLQSFLEQLWILRDMSLERATDDRYKSVRGKLEKELSEMFDALETHFVDELSSRKERKSDFFRDLAGAVFQHMAEERAKTSGVTFDQYMSVFDRVIFQVENRVREQGFEKTMIGILKRFGRKYFAKEEERGWFPVIDRMNKALFTEEGMVGTGYGRQRLPFPKEYIQSEILCHGYGAHHMFNNTATVLDIGGQDTKAIQLDSAGIVTSFQMNDRCAAGCGRYLGYIADEMNLGVHELGPLAMRADRTLRINSTCTVFAGAELRDRLALGEKREDILSGLHRAIILRAMSLLARSGGIRNEFTFTGGVAKNPAAVKALRQLVDENYGDLQINIDPDSIFTGALGAALFALEKPTVQALPTLKGR